MIRMTRRKLLSASLGGAAAWALWTMQRGPAMAAPPGDLPAGKTVVRTTKALGTAVSITVVHSDANLAERAIAQAFAEVRQIEEILSVYLPDSQVSRLNRDGALTPIDANDHLLTMLAASIDLSRRSEGAFDVTVQPLWELYASAAREKRIPRDDEIEAARRLVDWGSIAVEGSKVWFRKAGTKITFNGIAQGYATEHARAVLQSFGIEHALVDVGELAAMGDKPPGEAWKVGIQHPRAGRRVCVGRWSERPCPGDLRRLRNLL